MTRHPVLRLVPAAVVLGALVAGCMPEGNVDAADARVSVDGSTITVAGWAWDRDAPGTPIDVHVYIDGSGMATRADQSRADVGVAIPTAGANHGFSLSVNVAVGNHTVCTYGINAAGTPGSNTLIGRCTSVTVAPPPVPAPVVTTSPPTTTATAPTTVAPETSTPATSPATTAPAAPAPSTTVPRDPGAPVSWQDELVQRINTSRVAAGAAPLARCGRLETAAQGYAQTMAANQWFDTVGPDGSDAWTRVASYGGMSSGETLSFGFDSPQSVHASQMASPAQAAIVESPELTHIGAGRVLGDPDGDGPAAAAYYWVIEMGAGGSC